MTESKPVIRRSLAESLVACTAYQGQDSEPAAFGRALHSFAASYVLLCKEAGQETRIDAVEQLATEAFYRARGLSLGRLPEFLELCDRLARTWLAELRSLVAVEETLTHDVGWALLTCTLDRIDRTDGGDPDDDAEEELISDYKAEWTADGDHDFQMWWYVQMRFLTRPALRRIGFQIRLPRRKFQPEPYWFERGELDTWWAATLVAVREAWDIQQAGRGTPTGGVACQYCTKRYSCGAAVTSAVVLPENEEQATEVIQDWIRLQAATKEREDALKAFFAARDPLVCNGLEVGFLLPLEQPHPEPVGEPADVARWMDERGMEGAVALRSTLDWEAVPRQAWSELVEAGVAFVPDRPTFKRRKAQLARKGKKPATTEEPSTSASPRRQSRHASAAEKGGSAHPVAGAGSSVATTTEPPSLMDLLDRSLEKAEREQKAKQEGRA